MQFSGYGNDRLVTIGVVGASRGTFLSIYGNARVVTTVLAGVDDRAVDSGLQTRLAACNYYEIPSLTTIISRSHAIVHMNVPNVPNVRKCGE